MFVNAIPRHNTNPRQHRTPWSGSKTTPSKVLEAVYEPPHNHLLRLRGHIRKARRFRPGTVGLREIRKYQNSTELLIRKLSFQRLVKEVVYKMFHMEYRFQQTALHARKETSEQFLVSMFQMVNYISIHSKRQTIMSKDVYLWDRLCNYGVFTKKH